MHDMPLVIFTVLSQLVIGGFVTLWWLDRKNKSDYTKNRFAHFYFIRCVGGISFLVSILHLGQPFAAYRAILNIEVHG